MHADNTITTLLLGDVYGDPGCRAVSFKLKKLREDFHADYAVINGENSCAGFGLSVENMNLLFDSGADVITSGNHIWNQEEILPFLDSEEHLLRPANYGNMVPGHGWCTVGNIAVINVQGRMNMCCTEDPFRWASDVLRKIQTRTVYVDFHAENADEKEAMAFFLEGKVTAVVGTHTHVQTSDERILPGGTAYITDIGMCGPQCGIIGSDTELSIQRQVTQMPMKAKVLDQSAKLCGVAVISDSETGKALEIIRIADV